MLVCFFFFYSSNFDCLSRYQELCSDSVVGNFYLVFYKVDSFESVQKTNTDFEQFIHNLDPDKHLIQKLKKKQQIDFVS